MRTNGRTLLSLLLAACMLLALAACGGTKAGEPAAPAGPIAKEEPAEPAAEEEPAAKKEPTAEEAEFRTMGDVFAYDSENNGFSNEYYVYVFEKDGVDYRAIAALPEEVASALWELDIFDEEYDAKVREAVGPLEIARFDDLTGMIPSREELDALAGSNVGELLADGWSFWYWNMEEMEGGMYHGPFSFLMEFDGEVEDPQNFDESQAGALTVKSVSFDGIGDAVSDVLGEGSAEESDVLWEDDAAVEGEALEDWQNPVMNFIGEYQCDRAHMLVGAEGMDGYTIIVEWGDSARSLAKWVIEGTLDGDTMTAQYDSAVKTYVTYDDNGGVESEELLSDQCSGTVTFNGDGTITWHDDQSEYGEDMVFSWAL